MSPSREREGKMEREGHRLVIVDADHAIFEQRSPEEEYEHMLPPFFDFEEQQLGGKYKTDKDRERSSQASLHPDRNRAPPTGPPRRNERKATETSQERPMPIHPSSARIFGPNSKPVRDVPAIGYMPG